MKRINVLILLLGFLLFSVFAPFQNTSYASADSSKKYFTVYDESGKVLFLKGDDINVGDNYLSGDNKLYEVYSVDDSSKTAKAKFILDEKMPEYKVKAKKSSNNEASAKTVKKVGVYHTHNDESYFTPDGIDSVYGKGGIHDVGKQFVKNLNTLGIETVYREDLHLPHNSGAYTRSQVTASALLSSGVQAIFDLHRDSTKRDYYLTKVNGEQMSSIRMVIGRSSVNFEENKKFAYSIKSYADSVYPGLIKDIYIGKGNYNQQLSTRAMLFEMGCENIEKELVLKSTNYLAKTLDVVLYGSDSASAAALDDVDLKDESGNASVIEGVAVSTGGQKTSVNSNKTLIITLSIVGVVVLTLALILIFSKKARYKTGRFFSEMFAGLFGKKKKID